MLLYSEHDIKVTQEIAIQQIKKGEDKRVWIRNVLQTALMGTLEYTKMARIIEKVILEDIKFFDEVHTKDEIKQFCNEITK